MKRRLLTALVAGAFVVAPVHADPPLRTDDAYIVDPGSCQLEGQISRQRGGEREQALEFGCGLNKWLELTASRASGRSTLLQAKVLPLPMDHSPYGYGFTVGIVNSRPRDGGGATDPFINLIAGLKLLEERAAIYVNAGVERDRRANLTRGTAGVGAEYTVNPHLQLVAEVTGRRGEKPAPLVGVRLFPIPEHLHVTVAAGKRSYTAGFHWDF